MRYVSDILAPSPDYSQENADWLRERTWDGPAPGTPEFAALLKLAGLTEQDILFLPVAASVFNISPEQLQAKRLMARLDSAMAHVSERKLLTVRERMAQLDEIIIPKHKGPGAHPSGSPQAVHAAGRLGAPAELATPTEKAYSNAVEWFNSDKNPLGPMSRDIIKGNLVAVLDRASEKAITRGAMWYGEEALGLAAKLGQEHEIGTRAAAGVIAALAPQKFWADPSFPDEVGHPNSNQWQAERLLQVMRGDFGDTLTISSESVADLFKARTTANGRTLKPLMDEAEMAPFLDKPVKLSELPAKLLSFTHPAMQMSGVMGKDGQEMKIGVTPLDIEKSIRIYRGDDPADVLGGNKIRSFFNNIIDPRNQNDKSATIDTHMVRLMMNDKAQTIDSNAASGKYLGTDGRYQYMADIVREVAATWRDGDYSEAQIQAIAWTQWRYEGVPSGEGT